MPPSLLVPQSRVADAFPNRVRAILVHIPWYSFEDNTAWLVTARSHPQLSLD